MGFDLYRCSVIIATLYACALTTPESTGQELVPAPIAQSLGTHAWVENAIAVVPGTLDRLHSPLLRNDLKISGAQSCATSNCHGGPRPGVLDTSSSRAMEYQLWVERDPHSRSWRTICGDESVAMMRRLGIMEGNQIVDPVGFDNCLACHNTTQRFAEPRVDVAAHTRSNDDLNHFHREGVGCAACHGPSQRWIGTHFQHGWSAQGATGEGFVEAGDLYVRARMCASCHVGDKDRDMNHDIIAAGHPTLRYEMATFHAWQPKHWRDAEARDKTFYEAQLWLAGQVAATDASLALLAARASATHSVGQWPEFAAYNCASCHHNLSLDNDRTPLGKKRKATAIYSQWNDAGLRWLISFRIENGHATQQDYELLGAIDTVKERMETRPRPNAESVAQAAAHARTVLAAWFDGTPGLQERRHFRSHRLGQVVASAAGKLATFESWESAAQFYLAAVAARESWPGGWNGPIRKTADQLQHGLRYPEMIDISRFSKRTGHAPTVTRNEAMKLGIELGGWLGPVAEEMMDSDDHEVTEQMREELRDTIERINQRLKAMRDQRIELKDESDPDAATRPENNDASTSPKPMTREQLLEALRQRRESRSQENQNDGRE